jgi:hypothetical protein
MSHPRGFSFLWREICASDVLAVRESNARAGTTRFLRTLRGLMGTLMKQPFSGFVLVCLLLSALARGSAQTPDASAVPWVEWDRATEHVVSAAGDAGAAYPRAKQLSNGEILLAYHCGAGLGDYGAAITLRKSRDGGATWYQTQQIEHARERGFWGFSNPDFVELGNGRLLLVCAARGKPDRRSEDEFTSEGRHSGLRIRFSADYGNTWGPPRMIAAGIGRVWEPSIVRLSGGELEIFYANESPDLQAENSSQCIECIRSRDMGQTWSHGTVVSEDANCRNGMPAALALANGHVVCSQEVVGRATSPWIADTLQGRTDGFHLAQDQYDFGAAPFLARAPDGSTLLAYHSQELQAPNFKHLPMAWMFSQIYVQRGDAEAGNFGPASCPWPPAANRLTGAFFPSLLVLNDRTLVALASFISVRPNHSTSTVVRWIQGTLHGVPVAAATGGTAAVVSPGKKTAAPTGGATSPHRSVASSTLNSTSRDEAADGVR